MSAPALPPCGSTPRSPDPPRESWKAWLAFGALAGTPLALGWFATENEAAAGLVHLLVRLADFLTIAGAVLSAIVWLCDQFRE